VPGLLAALFMTLSSQVLAAGPGLQAFGPTSLQQIAKQQGKHSYWLVLWDLECGYCLQSMKNLAQVQKTHPGLRIVTVATDPIEQQEALQQRLASIGLKSSAWAFGQASEPALRYAIDPAWRGEKPRAYRYAPGQARQVFVGVLDESRILTPPAQTDTPR
jgi:thiol-disulfide isomerase/thioredoxin